MTYICPLLIPNGESWPWITDLILSTDLAMKELRVKIYEDGKEECLEEEVTF